jgi:hypothetical protein
MQRHRSAEDDREKNWRRRDNAGGIREQVHLSNGSFQDLALQDTRS